MLAVLCLGFGAQDTNMICVFCLFFGVEGGYFDHEQELHQVPKCSEVLFDKMYLATEATVLLPRHRTVQF